MVLSKQEINIKGGWGLHKNTTEEVRKEHYQKKSNDWVYHPLEQVKTGILNRIHEDITPYRTRREKWSKKKKEKKRKWKYILLK